MSSIVVEKEIYGSSLCWWPGDPTIPTGAVDSELGQSYDLNACAVEVWRARGKNGEGLPPMRVKKVSIEPLWASSYLDPFTYLSTDLYAFSATNDLEFKVNKWGPQSNLDVVNDFHMDDEFVVNEQESLMIRLSGAQIVGAGTGANAIKNAMWDAWRESVAIKVRFEMVPHDPTERYFSRTNFNDLDWKPPSKVDLLTDTELTLLDLRPELCRYPGGGYDSGSRYMYSIILHTEGKPSETKNIRTYIRYSGGNASDLEINGLLKDIGPIAIKKGQWLTVKIFLFEFALNSTAASASYRQMPAIWLNGSIT